MGPNYCRSYMLISIFDKNFERKNDFLMFDYENIYSFNDLITNFNYYCKDEKYNDEYIKIEWVILHLIIKNVVFYIWKDAVVKFNTSEEMKKMANIFLSDEKDEKKIFPLIYEIINKLKLEKEKEKINMYHAFFNYLIYFENDKPTCDFKICHLYDNKYWIYKKGNSLDIVNIIFDNEKIKLILLIKHDILDYQMTMFYNPI